MEALLLPGAEFFFQRVQAAERLPEAQHTADQQLMLRLHAQLSAAAVVLLQTAASLEPPEGEEGGPAAAAGGPRATAALLRYLAADWCDAPASTRHPELPPQLLARHLPPLVQLRRSGGGDGGGLALTFTPLLDGYLEQTRPLPEEDIDVVARLMVFAALGQLTPSLADSVPQLRAALAALEAVARGSSLFTDRRRFARQLRRLTRQLQGGGGGGGHGAVARGRGLRAAAGDDDGGGRHPLLPSVDQLRVACLHLRFSLALRWGTVAGRDATRAVLQPLARAIERLQPDSPRSGLLLAAAISPEETHLQDPCPHLRRALELARQQGSDLYTAAAAWGLAAAAAALQSPDVPPWRAAELLGEGEAAWQRAKHALPHSWVRRVESLRARQGQAALARPSIQRHARESPDRWRDDIHAACEAAEEQALRRQERQRESRPMCQHCRRFSLALKRCSKCRTAHYCSRRCQELDWPRHRAECRRIVEEEEAARQRPAAAAAAVSAPVPAASAAAVPAPVPAAVEAGVAAGACD